MLYSEKNVWRVSHLASVIVFLCFAQSAVAELRVVKSFQYGNWRLGVWADDGVFAFCSGSASYNSGVTLNITQNGSANWRLMFCSDRWRRPESEIAIGLRFEGYPWERGPALADGNCFFINAEEYLVERLANSSRLEMRMPTDAISFKLTGSRKLINEIRSCVADNISPQVSGAGPTETRSGHTRSQANQISTGTGFFVSRNGHLLTNQHVVSKCRSISVSLPGDIPSDATLLFADETNDLAVLKTSSPKQIVAFRQEQPKMGEAIVAFGYPLSGTLSASGNIVSGLVSALSGLNDDSRYLQITAPIQPGNSGGPLFDTSGRVVGLVSGKINELAAAQKIGTLPQNVNFALKSSVALSFLASHSVPYFVLPTSVAIPHDPSTIASEARQHTALVTCQR